MLNAVPLVLGAIAGYLAGLMPTGFLLMLLLWTHRALVGISNGITIGVASMYLTEVAPRSSRGLIGACHQLAITLGIFVSQCVGTDLLFGSFGSNQQAQKELAVVNGEFAGYMWHWALGLNAIPALISLPLMALSVETPRYLLITLGDENEARKGLFLSPFPISFFFLQGRPQGGGMGGISPPPRTEKIVVETKGVKTGVIFHRCIK